MYTDKKCTPQCVWSDPGSCPAGHLQNVPHQKSCYSHLNTHTNTSCVCVVISAGSDLQINNESTHSLKISLHPVHWDSPFSRGHGSDPPIQCPAHLTHQRFKTHFNTLFSSFSNSLTLHRLSHNFRWKKTHVFRPGPYHLVMAACHT